MDTNESNNKSKGKSKTMNNDKTEDVKCYQCKSDLCEFPLKFNCNHYMCSSCIIHELLLNQFKFIENKQDILFSCKCHSGTNQMSFEDFITILKEMTKERAKGSCRKHNIKGVKYCTECELWLCDKCISIHSEFNDHHKLIEEEHPIKKLCVAHGELTRFYCTMCKMEICPLCVIKGGQHHVHNYFELNHFAVLTNEITMKFKQKTADDFAKFIENINNEVMESIDVKYKETMKLFDDIYAQLEIVKNEYITRIENSKQRAKEVIDIITYSFFYFYQELNRHNQDSNTLYYLNQVIELSSIIPFFSETTELNEVMNHLNAFGNIDYFSYRINNNENPYVFEQTNLDSMLKKSLTSSSSTTKRNNKKRKEFRVELKIEDLNDFVYAIQKLTPDKRIAFAIGKEIVVYEDIFLDKENKYIMAGHNKSILCLSQVNEEKLASGSEDKTIKIWSLKSKQCLSTITGSFEIINCLLTLPSGHLAAGSHSTIKVFNIGNKTELYSLIGHEKSVACIIQINPNMIISSSYDNTIKIWDLTEKTCEYTLFGHDQTVYCVLLLKNGKLASASGSWDRTIKIWSIRNKKCEYNLTGHQREVRALIQMHNGYLVSGSTDNTVKIWNLHLKECIQTIAVHNDVIFSLGIIEERKFIIGSRDKSVSIIKHIN